MVVKQIIARGEAGEEYLVWAAGKKVAFGRAEGQGQFALLETAPAGMADAEIVSTSEIGLEYINLGLWVKDDQPKVSKRLGLGLRESEIKVIACHRAGINGWCVRYVDGGKIHDLLTDPQYGYVGLRTWSDKVLQVLSKVQPGTPGWQEFRQDRLAELEHKEKEALAEAERHGRWVKEIDGISITVSDCGEGEFAVKIGEKELRVKAEHSRKFGREMIRGIRSAGGPCEWGGSYVWADGEFLSWGGIPAKQLPYYLRDVWTCESNVEAIEAIVRASIESRLEQDRSALRSAEGALESVRAEKQRLLSLA